MSLPPTNAGRNPVPMNLLEERREMEISLKVAGLSMRSILAEINRLNSAKHWGQITLRTLERDIAEYYRQNRVSNKWERRDHFERLREVYIAQMEDVIEQAAMHIAEKNKAKNWRPFEKMIALEKFQRMQTNFADIQGWNLSKSKTTIKIEEIMAGGQGDQLRAYEDATNPDNPNNLGELAKRFPDQFNKIHEAMQEMINADGGVTMENGEKYYPTYGDTKG